MQALAQGRFEKTHAFGTAKFVRRAAEKMTLPQAGGGKFPNPLCRIAEERNFALSADG